MTTPQIIVLIVYFTGIPFMALLQGLAGTVWKVDRTEISIISIMWPVTIIVFAVFGFFIAITKIFSAIFSIPAKFVLLIRKKFINWKKPIVQSCWHGDYD